MKTLLLALFLALLLATVAAQQLSRSKRLTAFGKSPSNPSSPPPPLVGKGKECKSNQDCAHIIYSSCKTDDRDLRKRCICNDGSPIKNGQCVNRPRDAVLFRPAPTPPFFPIQTNRVNMTTTRKPLFVPHIRLGLRETCKNDGECLEGGECKINPNATTSASQRTTKVCLCREGRIEQNNQCNGSELHTQTWSVALAFGLLSILLGGRQY
ncbi:uncharacterized protein LOC106673085 isoform X2 [Cimex lectularius]|uniref:Uncharacterized protein n=1 Tax=Cimex lectularius TaxID=79782 RepID=A0A8I6SNL8_CIMLE|nr:uncharacterized protein LOC106673085 isoform X2 [Cimex lectularius]